MSPSLPHRRGGVSISSGDMSIGGGSSPQAWGCFYLMMMASIKEAVFPTGVGVFLSLRHRAAQKHSLPHRRGGVSAGGKALKD